MATKNIKRERRRVAKKPWRSRKEKKIGKCREKVRKQKKIYFTIGKRIFILCLTRTNSRVLFFKQIVEN